jgi:hypothetical protein
MGYSHYFKNKPAFTDSQWAALTDDVKKLIKNSNVPLGDANGEIGTKPVFNSRHIMFNGIGDDSHETAVVCKGASEFEFCKTAHKPYDSVVVEFYKLIRKYAPSTILNSDGGDEVFGGQKIVVNKNYTYLSGGFDVKVGDTVIVPSSFKGSEWQGTVTAIGSATTTALDYDGDCITILGVVQKDPETKPFDMDQIDPDDQITTEEGIATILFDKYRLREEDAADASREILKFVCDQLSSK